MMVLRTARPRDLEALMGLARRTGSGITTLPADAGLLGARLDRMARTLAGTAPLAEQGYLFVLEDLATGLVVGTSGIEAAVGLDQPFYTYRTGIAVHASRELDVWTQMTTLHLSNDLTGYSEVCSLFLAPESRANGNGGLLSRARLLFMAQFPERFGDKVCAELRGYFTETGQSPFWDALGQRFFKVDFDRADRLTAAGKKAFVAELMPKYPVYVDFLPDAARACIGREHADTAPARHLLEREGLRFEGHVDIFDAGPVLEARIADLRAMRQSRQRAVIAPVAGAPVLHAGLAPRTAADDGVRTYLVCNTRADDFRAMLVHGVPDDQAPLAPEVAAALGVTVGDAVYLLTFNPGDAP